MSTLSPPYSNDKYESYINTASSSHSMAGPSSATFAPGGILRMEDAVVETITTHTTRTTTQFKPLTLPRIPPPEAINMPFHLSAETYPLANEPSPDDMRFFALTLGGRRVVVEEDGSSAPSPDSNSESRGPGWVRHFSGGNPVKEGAQRMDLLQALNRSIKGKERKRPHDFARNVNHANEALIAPTPPISAENTGIRQHSPPRKKIRALEGLTIPDDNVLLSPLPSPDRETAPSSSTSAPNIISPSVGSGVEVAALFSLPSIVSQFDTLPDKLQQHILMHLFRRSRMPTIQRLSAFASTALRRDFISMLPHEIAINILKKVDVKSLASAARVSRKWRKMVDSERSVWKQRLVDDGMWYGLGVEEEDEALIKRRMDTLDWKARQVLPKAGTPSDDEHMDEPPSPGIDDRSTALKHVYRRRFTSDRDWMTNNPVHTSFPGHGTHVITCLQFDGQKIVSASDDHSVNVYSTTTGQLMKRLSGHEGGVWALEYKGDTLVTGSTDRTVRIWDLESLRQTHVFHGHQSTVRCLQIVEPVWDEESGEFQPPYPLVVTGSRDASLRAWRLPKKGEPAYRRRSPSPESEPYDPFIVGPDENPYHNHLLAGHTQAVRALAAHGKICVSGSYDTTVRVWDIVKGTCIHTLTGHEQKVYSIVYDRYRNRCASGSMDHTVKVWDVVTGQCLYTLNGHTSLVGLLGTSVNHLVSAAADASLRIWDSNTSTLKHVLSSHAGAITCFYHDETKVLSGADGTLKLWDIKTGAYIRDLVVGISSVWQIQVKGSQMVAASNRNGTTVFDVFDFEVKSEKGPNHVFDVDDESLDLLRRPAWERGNLWEPSTYQDEIDVVKPNRGALSPDQPRRSAHSTRSDDNAAQLDRWGSSNRRSNRLADRVVDPATMESSSRFRRRLDRTQDTAGSSSRPSLQAVSTHSERGIQVIAPARVRRPTSTRAIDDSSSIDMALPPIPSGRRRRSSANVSASLRVRHPVSPTPGSSRGNVFELSAASGSMTTLGMGMIGVNGQSFPPIFDDEGDDSNVGDDVDDLMDFDGVDVD